MVGSKSAALKLHFCQVTLVFLIFFYLLNRILNENVQCSFKNGYNID